MSEENIVIVVEESQPVEIEVTEGGSLWGDIRGDITDQIDLQNALNDKADTDDLGDLAFQDKVDWNTDIDNIPASFPPAVHNHDDRYYTETETDTLLSAKADTADLGDLAEKDKVDWDTDIDNIPQTFPPESHNHDDRYYTETETDDLLDTKQNTLTFDTTPTASSTNPVTSGGIKTALDDKADVITTSASGNPVTITDGSPSPVVDLTVGIEPVQDLHGLPNPYPAGGGNNTWVQITPGTYTNGGITAVVDSNNLITVSGTKNTNSGVIIEMPYQISGTVGKVNYYLHMRNTVAFANTEVYFNIVTSTTTKVYLTEINRILQNTADREFQSCGLAFTSSVPSGTEFNFTLQPSLENTDAVTEWTPYSNICPITGWTGANITREGRNLCPKFEERTKTVSGITYSINSDGQITFDGGTTTGNVNIYAYNDSTSSATSYFDIPNGNYIASGGFSSDVYFVLMDGSTRYDIQGEDVPITVTTGRLNIYGVIKSGTNTTGLVLQPIIISKNVYPITFPTEAGTVYGGSLDVTTGVLTVDSKFVTVTEVDSVHETATPSVRATINTAGEKGSSGKLLSSYLPNASSSAYLITHEENGVAMTSNLYIKIIGCKTKDEYNAYLTVNPLQVVYELATPLTYQLTPTEITTLLGENTISADTGAVDVTYRADTKTYIDQKIAESQRATRSLIAGIETEMIATKNYNIGDLLIVGDTLYKVTANIAITGAITVGTNVTATTVAEQLILLANA